MAILNEIPNRHNRTYYHYHAVSYYDIITNFNVPIPFNIKFMPLLIKQFRSWLINTNNNNASS